MNSNKNHNSGRGQTRGNNSTPTLHEALAFVDKLYEVLKELRNRSGDWLTVEEVAEELKISKSVVYRLIRKGELPAIDVADNDSVTGQRGHYRISQESLAQYIEAKAVKKPPDDTKKRNRSPQCPKVKNHLGL